MPINRLIQFWSIHKPAFKYDKTHFNMNLMYHTYRGVVRIAIQRVPDPTLLPKSGQEQLKTLVVLDLAHKRNFAMIASDFS